MIWVFLLALISFVLFACWLARGEPTNPQAPNTALSNPGSVGRDYGPLTPREWDAHEATLRELESE